MNQSSNTKSISLQDITMIGVFAAVIAIMAQISIPMPLGVPMTMQTFAITLAAVVLGAKYSAIASFVYLLLGAIGLPVFANLSGGIAKLIGPTGGFLLSFPIMAFLIGLGAQYYHKSKALFILFLILGTVVNYVVGVIMFCILMDSTVMVALSACVIPFIPTAIIKAILASVLGLELNKRLPR